MKTESDTSISTSSWQGMIALMAAIGASVCCVAPLVLLSLGIGQLFSHFAGGTFQMAYSTNSIVAAFICSSMIGIIFGFIPARNAAQLNPVDALSRE